MKLVECRQTESVGALDEVKHLALQHRHRRLPLSGTPGVHGHDVLDPHQSGTTVLHLIDQRLRVFRFNGLRPVWTAS